MTNKIMYPMPPLLLIQAFSKEGMNIFCPCPRITVGNADELYTEIMATFVRKVIQSNGMTHSMYQT
jgi:hypothetical protein